mmetsp:Transcript_58941/g.111271  ORF Transcript_58941/g.111271 Transcript_58941/m.111271 type:complete len:155 (-) Transcript_58941:109-573(-)
MRTVPSAEGARNNLSTTATCCILRRGILSGKSPNQHLQAPQAPRPQQQQQQQHLGEHRDYAAGRHTHQPAQAATVLTAGGTISQHQAQRQAVQQQQQQQRRSQSQLYTDNTSPVPRKTVPIGGGQAGGAQPWAAARRQQQQQQQQFDLVNKYKL